MHIDISGHHVDVTAAMRKYVLNKMGRIERHFDNVTDTHVVLEVEKLRHRAEATVHVAGSKLFAQSVEENMYAAIDSLVDKLDVQVRKHKEKKTDHHRAEGGLRSRATDV